MNKKLKEAYKDCSDEDLITLYANSNNEEKKRISAELERRESVYSLYHN